MPAIWIDRPCDEPQDLPDVCVRCGVQTRRRVPRSFKYVPAWTLLLLPLGLLPYYVVAAVLQRSCRVCVPICDGCRNHWTMRSVVALGSFVLFIPGGFVLTVLLSPLTRGTGYEALNLLGCATGIFGWFAFIVLMNYTAIRAGAITNDAVRMTGVCQPFIDAYRDLRHYREQRRAASSDRDDREPRPGPRRDDGIRERDDRPGRGREEDY